MGNKNFDKLREIAETVLRNQLPKELDFRYAGFSDTNGASMYFSVFKKGKDLEAIKARFSDHLVQNIDRMSNEAHFSFRDELQENSINKIGYLLGLDGYKYEQVDIKRQLEVSENNIRGRKVLKQYMSEPMKGSVIKPSMKYLVEDTIKNVWQYTNYNKKKFGGTIETNHLSLGTAKKLDIIPNIKEHDMIAECADCGEKFSYQNSKKNILWQCPECNEIKRIKTS